jgi:hypothetical protein
MTSNEFTRAMGRLQRMTWGETKRTVTALQRNAKLPGESKSGGQSVAVGLMLGGLADVLLWWIVF